MVLNKEVKELLNAEVLAEIGRDEGHVTARGLSGAERERDEEVLYFLAQHAYLCDRCAGKFPGLIELFKKFEEE